MWNWKSGGCAALTRPFFSGKKPPKAAREKPLVPDTPKTGTIASQVWNFLRAEANFARSFTPKALAAALRLRESTLRKELLRMEARGQVENVEASGWYRAWLDPGLLALREKPEPCIHALQMKLIGAAGGGLGVPRGGRQAVLSGATERGWAHDESNDQATFSDTLPGSRRVMLQASSTGVVLVNVRASDNPIRFAEWPEFYGYLKGWAHGKQLDLDAPTSMLVNVEFNADWKSYFLEGMKRMKLQAVGRAWGQIYQKHQSALRMELRVAPAEMTMREAAGAIVAMVHYNAVPALGQGSAPATAPAAWGMEVV